MTLLTGVTTNHHLDQSRAPTFVSCSHSHTTACFFPRQQHRRGIPPQTPQSAPNHLRMSKKPDEPVAEPELDDDESDDYDDIEVGVGAPVIRPQHGRVPTSI